MRITKRIIIIGIVAIIIVGTSYSFWFKKQAETNINISETQINISTVLENVPLMYIKKEPVTFVQEGYSSFNLWYNELIKQRQNCEIVINFKIKAYEQWMTNEETEKLQKLKNKNLVATNLTEINNVLKEVQIIWANVKDKKEKEQSEAVEEVEVETEAEVETEEEAEEEVEVEIEEEAEEEAEVEIEEEAEVEVEIEEEAEVEEKDTSLNSDSNDSSEYAYDFKRAGVVYAYGYKFTWYSQNVLPGGGLNIPGRHVNNQGFVCDGDGYIVAASDKGRGTIGNSPWGEWKSYDTGTTGNHIDLYTDF